MRKKNRKYKGMTDRDLQICAYHIDKTYFDSKLPGTLEVKFVKNLWNKGEKCDGIFHPSRMIISIDDRLRQHPDMCNIVLIHECAHVSLPNYKGGPMDKHHGMLFQAKIVELFNAGAYDGIL